MGIFFPIVIIVVFLVVGTLVYGVYGLMNPTRTASDRLSEFTGAADRGNSTQGNNQAADAISARLAKLAAPQDEDEQDVLKKQLIQAGFRNKDAPQLFNATRVALAVTLPLLIVPFASGSSLTSLASGVVVMAAAGYYLPQLFVTNAVGKRQAEILKPFPDALDLLVTCVESGLGLDAAIRRVGAEMESAAPSLSAEFLQVNNEISAGVPRVEALKHLGDRTGIPEVRSLVQMLVQADRFGTSIARSLRLQSEISRAKRMARAEEEAAKVSPKLTLVMILFFMPTLMVVLLGPAAVNIKNLFIDGQE